MGKKFPVDKTYKAFPRENREKGWELKMWQHNKKARQVRLDNPARLK